MLIGIDWGGTKIEGVSMDEDGRELLRLREVTPRHDYDGCIRAIRTMVDGLESKTGKRGSIGIGIPGSLEPLSRLGKGASSTWLLGKPVESDLRAGLIAKFALKMMLTVLQRLKRLMEQAQGTTWFSRLYWALVLERALL